MNDDPKTPSGMLPSRSDIERVIEERNRRKMLADEVLLRHGTMKSHRLLWERLWQEVRELIRPNAEDFTKRTPRAQNRKERIFDDFPSFALGNLAAGLHSRLTNSTSRWFSLSTREVDIDQDPSMAEYLDKSSDRIFDELADPGAGFNTSSHEFYLDCAGFGTGVIDFLEDDNNLRIRAIPLAQCFISENDAGIVDTVFREFEMTHRQAILKFGKDRLPKDIVEAKDQEQHSHFIHAVYPIKTDGPVPYKSVYVHRDTGMLVGEGMFHEFPYCVVRWTKMAGDVYGRAPGTDCLQNVRVLNEAMRLMLQSSQLQAAPPIVFDDDGVLSKIVLAPWAQMMKSPGSAMPQPLEIGGKLNVNQQLIDSLHDIIGKNFFNDLFDSADYGKRERVTATEVSNDQNTRMERLSPILGRFEVEFLNVLIPRMYAFLRRKGEIKEPPDRLKGKKLKIIYHSPAAQAQRAQKAQNTLRFLQTVLPFEQVKPGLLDAIDLDEVLKETGFAYDISRLAVRTDQDIEKIRNQRAQQQQAQAQGQQAVQASQAALNVAQAQQAAPGLLNQTPQSQLPQQQL